jgi:DNA-directed RNA polymerase subunit M/transcription elongation factor TFIIS
MPMIIGPVALNETRRDWLSQPTADRPTYTCPKCGELSLQFFRTLLESPRCPERTNSFVCHACGRSWQM